LSNRLPALLSFGEVNSGWFRATRILLDDADGLGMSSVVLKRGRPTDGSSSVVSTVKAYVGGESIECIFRFVDRQGCALLTYGSICLAFLFCNIIFRMQVIESRCYGFQ
jgi:hypothetical protein